MVNSLPRDYVEQSFSQEPQPHDRLCNGRGDLSASSCSDAQLDVTICIHDDRRAHGRHGDLSGHNEISWGWGNSVDIDPVGDGEVVHIVVQDDSSTRGDDQGTENRGQRN